MNRRGDLEPAPDSGVSATPSNATTMTNIGTPKEIFIQIGAGWTTAHTLVVKMNGAGGTTVFSATFGAGNRTTVGPFYLTPYQTWYCQYQTSQATFIVVSEN